MRDVDRPQEGNSSTLVAIDWKKETILVIFSAIVGGLTFSLVSPFIVPAIHDFQVNQLGAQNPTVGVEVRYAERIDGAKYPVPSNETYDRYTVHIQNPSQKQVSTLTVGFAFPGAIEYQQIGAHQASDEISYSRNARLVATEPSDNFSYTSNAVKVDELPPLKEVSVTFLIDRTLEKAPMPGYWETGGLTEYNDSRGTIMVSGQYRWQFKGSVYMEDQEYTWINASQRNSPRKYDVCVGKKAKSICNT